MVETWRIWPLKRTSRAPCSEKRISNWTSRSSIRELGPFLANWTRWADSVSLSPIVPRNSSGNQPQQFFRPHNARDHARRTRDRTKRQVGIEHLQERV